MGKCAVLIPVYKPELDSDEVLSVRLSLKNLAGHDIFWVAPNSLGLKYYEEFFSVSNVKRFPDQFFENVNGYSSLLVSDEFYSCFSDYEFILICQTDAVVLKPELGDWLNLPYDYVGAPWPSGYSININIPGIDVAGGVRCFAFVGNGGLSLRRVGACRALIAEFKGVSADWVVHGHAEDLFFSFLGGMSRDFFLPNLMTAARFSFDIEPDYLQQIIGGGLPFGLHAWTKYNRPKWEGYLTLQE